MQPPQGATNQVDNSGGEGDTPPKSQGDKLSEISRIYRGEPPEGAEGQPAGDGEGSEGAVNTSPTTLDDLAKSADIDVEALYKVPIPMGGEEGETLTLGELKDIGKKDRDLTVRELKLEEDYRKKNGDLLKAQGGLRELIAALPDKALTPEARQKAAELYATKVQAEESRTLELIEEWKDPQTRKAEEEEMRQHLMEYGLPSTYLDSVIHAEARYYIRENMLREKRINAAIEQAEKVSPGSTGTGAAAPKHRATSGIQRRGRVQTQREQTAQASRILNEGLRRA